MGENLRKELLKCDSSYLPNSSNLFPDAIKCFPVANPHLDGAVLGKMA